MKKINELSKDLGSFQKRLEEKLIKAQRESAEQIQKDVIKHLGHSSGKYVDSTSPYPHSFQTPERTYCPFSRRPSSRQ